MDRMSPDPVRRLGPFRYPFFSFHGGEGEGRGVLVVNLH